MDLDWDRLAREAPTRFERIYYGQRGRLALKWAPLPAAFCEDLHTSYWETFGGGLGKGDTFIGYVKAMIDRLHGQYYGHDRAPDDLSRTVGPMLVADSMVAFDKVEPVGDAYMAWVERRGGG